MLKINKIHNENCLDTMYKLPANCIDLVLTSPPYDHIKNYDINTKFDYKPIIKELYRIIKEGSVVVWIVDDQHKNGNNSGTSFRQAIYAQEIGFNLFDVMIYKKSARSGYGDARTYWKAFEYMFIFSKGVPKTINLIKDRKNKTVDKNRRITRKSKNGNKIIKYTAFGRRTNIWEYKTGKSNSSTDNFVIKHPAIFPEKLANDHIISWSNKGDLVYDPFMGAGTTAKMCILNNRNYIGSELNKQYCEIINKRIKNCIVKN